MLAGLAVPIVSVAVRLGARASRPVRALAAARAIEAQRLDRVPPLPPSRVAEFDDTNRSFNQMLVVLGERALIRETLGRFVPADIAKTLLSDGGELAPEQSEETVLWCMKWIEHRYEIILYWSAKKADADLNDGHAAATLDANLQPPTKSTGRPVFDAESRPSNRERLPSRAPRRVSRIRLSRVVKGPLD